MASTDTMPCVLVRVNLADPNLGRSYTILVSDDVYERVTTGELKDVDDADELLKQAGRWLERQPALLEEMEAMREFMAKSSVPPDPEVTNQTFERALTRLLKALQDEEEEVETALEERETRLGAFKVEARAALAAVKRADSTARGAGQPLVSALLTPTLRALLARGCTTDVRVGVQHPLPSLGPSLQVIWHIKVKVTATSQLDIRGLGVDPGSDDVIVGDAASKKLLRYSSEGELRSTHDIGCAPCSLAVGEEAVAVVADGKLLLFDVHDLSKKKSEVSIPGGFVGNSVPAPSTVAALGRSRFLVGNVPSNTLAVFDSSGKLLDIPICPVQNPVISLFEVSDDRWLLSSWRDNKVVLASSDGQRIRSFQREVRGNKFHWQPNYAVALESGHVVVADYYFHEVVVFDPQGKLIFQDSVPGLEHPRNLAYCPSMQRLVASNPRGDMVAFSVTV